MRKLSRGLRKTAKGLGFVVWTLLFILAVLIWRPEWFLPPRLIAKAVKTFGKAYHPEWKEFEVRLHSKSFATKQLVVHARDFGFADSSGTMKGFFRAIEADVTAKLTTRGVLLTRVARLDVYGRELKMDFSRPSPKAVKKKKEKQGTAYAGVNGLLPSSLRRLRIDEIDVQLPDNTLVLSSTQSVSGDVSLTYSTSLVLAAQLYQKTPEKAENIDVTLAVDSDLFSKGALTYLHAVGKLAGDVENAGRLEARIDEKKGGALELRADAKLASGTKDLTARLRGSQTAERFAAKLDAAVRESSGAIRELALNGCTVDAPTDKKQQIQSLALRCDVSAEPAPFGVKPGTKAKKIDVLVSLDGKRTPKPLKRDAFEAKLKATVKPRKDWVDFRADLQADLAGRLGDIPRSLTSRHKIAASLDVAKFQDLVTYLEGTRYAIPAPLHVMTGPVRVTLDSKGDTTKPDQVFVYKASTDLSSGKQKLVARVDGRLIARQLFTPGRKLEDKTDVVLKDVALELPYLKVGAVPPLTVDSRIRTGEEKMDRRAEKRQAQEDATVRPSTASAVDYVARIRTDNPVKLLSNLNPQPIPIALDLSMTPAGMNGTIAIQSFDAELFKKKGHVDHLSLKPAPGARAMDLDGLIQFSEDEADIALKLLGSTEKPRVIFESEPPMDQQAIIALLLFGKSPDDLDPDQNATVSNSQSAMANGAFGLASLYLFASTPIQYVGYDPATQTYAIKFSLPGGASLEVGSGADQSKHLTLRKRLARHWVLQTEVSRDEEQRRNAVTTFLEWFQRY